MAGDKSLGAVSVVHSSNRSEKKPPDLRLLHYNDVYHIEPGSADPCGGLSRFQTVVDHYRTSHKYSNDPKIVTVFSGDAFNPSLESTVTKGKHMVSVLNSIGTDVACVGNHDLDFGVPQFQYLGKQCKFPWLLANVLDPDLGEDRTLGDVPKTHMIEASNGIKIGLIGLGEREWLETINSLPPNLQYLSASAVATKLIPSLREAGADLIIALTHQRDPNDIKLAEKTPAGLIDIVLGGHDHHYTHEYVNGTHILCSGSDFKQLSYIEARRKPDGQPGWDFDIVRHDINRGIAESKTAVKLVMGLTTDLKKTLEEPVGYTAAPLDGRFSTIRANESNLGNFVCDLMRFYYNCECTIMAAGTIRGDQVYPPGVLLLKDILNCFPFEDPVVALRVTGAAIVDALENAIGKLPALEGRFPQVSNIQFQYDAKRPSGRRLLWTKVNNEPIDPDRKYTVATRGYMARGKDGYTALLAASEGGVAEEVVNEEEGVLISTIIRQYFLSLKVIGQWAQWSNHMTKHWAGVHKNLHAGGKIKQPGTSLQNTHLDYDSTVKSSADGTEFELSRSTLHDGLSALPYGISGGGFKRERESHLARKYFGRWKKGVGMGHSQSGLIDEEEENNLLPMWTNSIAPKIEGRILLA